MSRKLDERGDDESNPRIVRASKHLAALVARLCHGRLLDRQLINDLQTMADDFRTKARQDGVPFPKMVVVALDERKHVRLARRDLETSGIDGLAVELVQSEGASPEEVARAIRRAYPHHRIPMRGKL